MSNYTTQLRFICESKSGLEESTGFGGIMDAIEGSREAIFDFDWPIFDESYRAPLEIKILRHFYTREIGEETFGLWQLRLCDRLNVIMPYYNQLYESELIKFNPLWDVDLTTDHSKINGGESESSSSHTNEKTDNRQRESSRSELNDGVVNTEFDGNRKNLSSVDQTENVKRDSVVDTTNLGVWDSETARSNVSTSKNEGERERKNKNVNRYSDTPQGNVNIGGSGTGEGNVDVDSLFGNGYLTNVTIVDDKTNSNDRQLGENTNDSIEQGKTTQDWTKQDSTKGSSDRNVSGLQEEVAEEKNASKTENSNVVSGEEKEGISGSENSNYVGNGRTVNNSTEDFIQHVFGKRGGFTYSKMLDDFRKTFLNIDKMILNELDSLFIGLWE